MGEVTHDQANLMLRLYELRREPRLRQAREWYGSSFFPQSMDEMMKTHPFGSIENASVRMVITYWEMAAGMVNRGLIDEEFFFENTGEQWLVFERIKPVLEEWRTAQKNPFFLSQLEQHVKKLEAWRERRAPGINEAARQRFAAMQAARVGKK